MRPASIWSLFHLVRENSMFSSSAFSVTTVLSRSSLYLALISLVFASIKSYDSSLLSQLKKSSDSDFSYSLLDALSTSSSLFTSI